MFGCPIQTYRGYPNICGAPKCMGAYGHPLSLTKDPFFVLCMDRGISKHMGHTCPHACVDAPHMFWTPPYVWMPLVCLDTPYVWTHCICLDAPCMFGHSIFGHPSCILGAPHVLMPPSKHTGVSKHMWGIQVYGGIQTSP